MYTQNQSSTVVPIPIDRAKRSILAYKARKCLCVNKRKQRHMQASMYASRNRPHLHDKLTPRRPQTWRKFLSLESTLVELRQ